MKDHNDEHLYRYSINYQPRQVSNILRFPHPALMEAVGAIDIVNVDIKLIHQFFKSLVSTLDATENGIALSANQIGINAAMFVHNIYGDYQAVINPVFHLMDHYDVPIVPEGCLSLPEHIVLHHQITRARKIAVTYWTYPDLAMVERRFIEGFEAQVFQHEYDHLQGKMIIDHLMDR